MDDLVAAARRSQPLDDGDDAELVHDATLSGPAQAEPVSRRVRRAAVVDGDALGDDHAERRTPERARRARVRSTTSITTRSAPRAASSRCRTACDERRRGARHDDRLGRVPLVDRERAPDAVADERDRVPRRVVEVAVRRLRRSGLGRTSRSVRSVAFISSAVFRNSCNRHSSSEPGAASSSRSSTRPLHAEERVGDVVTDVAGEVAERSRPRRARRARARAAAR